VEPLAGTWAPWNLASGSQFRPPEPPRPGDPAFDRELQEVWLTGVDLELDGQQIASYWEDKAGSLTPPGHWTALALRMLRADGWSSDQAALALSVLATAQADAFISGWDSKFTYWSLRPVTAIRERLDPGWVPYIPTPNFPSYVSGHSITSGAAAEVLAAFWPARADELRACAREAADSRLLGGIHFRADNETGLDMGTRVGEVALARTDAVAVTATTPVAAGPLGCLWAAGRSPASDGAGAAPV
jgi:hypothetical protein